MTADGWYEDVVEGAEGVPNLPPSPTRALVLTVDDEGNVRMDHDGMSWVEAYGLVSWAQRILNADMHVAATGHLEELD